MNLTLLQQSAIFYGQKVLFALITLFIGLKLIKYVMKLIEKPLQKTNIEKSVHTFLLSLIRSTLKILLFITIASKLGLPMTSFIAILGSAGLAVGLALQGSLSNFSGGILILLLRPFKIGDFIEGAGYMGTVEEIQIFYTILNTPDNRVVTIPNSNLSNSTTVNYSTKDTRRVDLVFGVGYEDNIFKVKEVLNRVVNAHEMILASPAPMIKLSEHGYSSVNFIVRVWCKSENYWNVHFDLLETVKLEFDKENINIPYPQMDINITNKN